MMKKICSHFHYDIVPKVALKITTEHIAKETVENQAGELIESGQPEGTGIFIPFNKNIIDITLRNLKKNNVNRVF